MRHMKAGRKLNRSPSHRLALRRNLARALFMNGRIITTVAKAKDVRPFVEKLITLAKKANLTEDRIRALHYRRLALQRLPDKDVIKLLFEEIGPRFLDRPGGYTRIVKRHERRLGDGGETAFLELLKEGEEKVLAKVRYEGEAAPAPAPAPAVTEPEEEETPTPEAEGAPAEGTEEGGEETPAEEKAESEAEESAEESSEEPEQGEGEEKKPE